MPELSSIGRLIARGLESPKYSAFMAGAAGFGVLGAIEGRKLSKSSFDYTSQILLGTPQADQAITGTDLGWSNFVVPSIMPPEYIGAPMFGGMAGAAVGGVAGGIGLHTLRDAGKDIGKLGGLGLIAGGLTLGGMLGFGIGFKDHTMKYINETSIHNAFAPNLPRRTEQRLAQDNVKKGYNNTDVPNSIFPYGGAYTDVGVAADEDYYASDFPGPVNRPRGYTTGATGDLVLGAYNMRMR